jgi:hypothetical protein
VTSVIMDWGNVILDSIGLFAVEILDKIEIGNGGMNFEKSE